MTAFQRIHSNPHIRPLTSNSYPKQQEKLNATQPTENKGGLSPQIETKCGVLKKRRRPDELFRPERAAGTRSGCSPC